MMGRFVFDRSAFQLVFFHKIFEERITFVVSSWRDGGVGITPNENKRVRELVADKVNGVLEKRKFFHEFCFLTPSWKIDTNVNAGLESRFFQQESHNVARMRLKDGNVSIKLFFPHSKGASMCSRLRQGEKRVMVIF